MGRVIVCGDQHGAHKALIQCLERSGFDKENDTLICLGDVADGYGEVPECVEELLTIKNLISIKGNHDVFTCEWMKFGDAKSLWLSQGGQDTLNAYVKRHPDLLQKHLEQFFSKQINYYIDDQNRGFVHGGFTSRKGLGHEPYESNYYWDRDMWSLVMMYNDRPEYTEITESSARFMKHKEIYIGHTSTQNWNVKTHYPEYNDPNQAKNGRITVPMNRCNVWNLDTGCGFRGVLTFMDIESKEYFQSDSTAELYPNEQGR